MVAIREYKIRKIYDSPLKDLPIFYYDQVDSTNTQLKKLSESQDLPSFTICLADQQTKGRGRLGKSFESPRGTGIYLSILVHEDLAALNLVTLQVAVAASMAIEKLTHLKPQIKWVNDLYLSNKKVAGILTEGVVEDGKVTSAIVGIGINVNTPRSSFTPELQAKAGSLAVDLDRNLLIGEIVNHFRKVLTHYTQEEVIQMYKSRCFILGEKVSFERDGKVYQARAVDINSQGHLIAQTSSGLMELSAGEVSLQGSWSKK